MRYRNLDSTTGPKTILACLQGLIHILSHLSQLQSFFPNLTKLKYCLGSTMKEDRFVAMLMSIRNVLLNSLENEKVKSLCITFYVE